MENSHILKAELMDALGIAIAFYQGGYPKEGKSSLKKFVSQKLPELNDSICYKSFALFAKDEHVGTWASWKWKKTDERWSKLNEYVENYQPFSGFLVLAAASTI